MIPAQKPIPPKRRHPADHRDEEEHAEVARALSVLPENLPARVAYSSGAREVSDSISLTWLVAERRDIVQALVDTNMVAWRRIMVRHGDTSSHERRCLQNPQ